MREECDLLRSKHFPHSSYSPPVLLRRFWYSSRPPAPPRPLGEPTCVSAYDASRSSGGSDRRGGDPAGCHGPRSRADRSHDRRGRQDPDLSRRPLGVRRPGEARDGADVAATRDATRVDPRGRDRGRRRGVPAGFARACVLARTLHSSRREGLQPRFAERQGSLRIAMRVVGIVIAIIILIAGYFWAAL